MKNKLGRSPAVLYCPICTRYVDGQVEQAGRKLQAAPGQKCPRCASTLDAAIVVQLRQAA
ncbi:MAG: hypothetical protein HYR60_14460 [Acidobacteria bacterium]|nr:hypothetical protein [Acidobacteriota bacterium]